MRLGQYFNGTQHTRVLIAFLLCIMKTDHEVSICPSTAPAMLVLFLQVNMLI
jgi:hypothetical protein